MGLVASSNAAPGIVLEGLPTVEVFVDPDEQLLHHVWRFLVIRRTGRCERCGAADPPSRYRCKRSVLEAHHKNWNEDDHRLSNGECLCSDCHRAEHRESQVAVLRANAAAKKGKPDPANAARGKALWADPTFREKTIAAQRRAQQRRRRAERLAREE